MKSSDEKATMTKAPTSREANKIYIAGLGLALACALAFRVYRLGAGSLDVDESFSAAYAADLSLVLKGVRPPVYFVLLAAWRWVFSDGLFALRFPSVIFGVMAVFLVARLGEKLADRRTGLVAAFLLAGIPLHIAVSRQAQVYSLLLALSLAALVLLIRVSEEEDDITGVGLLAAVNVLGIFTAYLYIFALISQIFMLIFLRRGHALRRRGVLIALGAPWAALLFATPFVYAQFKTLALQLASFPALSRIGDAPLALWIFDLGMGAPWNYLGEGGSYLGAFCSLAGVFFFLLGTASCLTRKTTGEMAILSLAYATPLALLIPSFILPLWAPATLTIFIPFYLLVMAYGFLGLGKAAAPLALLLSLLAGAGMVSNARLSAAPGGAWRKPPDWNALTTELVRRYAPGDNLVVVPGWMAQALSYHLQHNATYSANPGHALPIIQIPFDFYNRDAGLKNRVDIPAAPRTWVVAGAPYPEKTLAQLLEDEGLRQSHKVNFWRLDLTLYRPVALEAPQAEP